MCARCLRCPVLTCVPQQSLTLAELWFFCQKQTLLYEFSSQIHYIKTENARQNRSYSHLKTLGGSYKSNRCSPIFLNIYAQKHIYIFTLCKHILWDASSCSYCSIPVTKQFWNFCFGQGQIYFTSKRQCNRYLKLMISCAERLSLEVVVYIYFAWISKIDLFVNMQKVICLKVC